ncbi:hypothetical protein COLO4_22629 [Corchorus olitorius]|uniref:Uncharacterized protein n=1 Tax=Corchorus olitorius TaxID=93759 RepID=A0A1R3IKW8_9ROSI|nr:hypothetical protein COLO4_22629 [Corchorus olitorius]
MGMGFPSKELAIATVKGRVDGSAKRETGWALTWEAVMEAMA